METILVVAAHPDDEVLGCGGTIARHADEGDEIHIIFLADGISSRNEEEMQFRIEERNKSACVSCEILGAESPSFIGLPDNRMDTIALLEIVQTLEEKISRINASIIYTHHAGDLNIDHRITHQAVMTACRPCPEQTVREIYSFEVLSSTEWNSPSSFTAFMPQKYVDISTTLDRKLAALHCYKQEMREFPHSRSLETIEILAKYRGSTMGILAAEAFMVERLVYP